MPNKSKFLNIDNNTLFLGNGFSRSVAPKIPAWKELFKEEKNSAIKNYTILYEKKYINNCNKEEKLIKKELTKQIEIEIKNAIQEKESVAQWFSNFLKENNVGNIITTNYDKGIEYILQRCGYLLKQNNSSEKLYSIRRSKFFTNPSNNHSVILWKIHGDIDAIKSVTLGYDQYCGSLSKLMSYIKGKYEPSKSLQNNIGTTTIEEKCKNPTKRDNSSWAELFFFSNIYILGFGMDFSEIDIWWLLNRRTRIKIKHPNLIKNNITYYLNTKFDNKDDIIDALKTFKVVNKKIQNESIINYMHYKFNA